MTLSQKYENEAGMLAGISPSVKPGSVAWRSPSNIALIKYWGKRDFQLPQNPSLSFVLEKSFTETSMEYRYKGNKGSRNLKFDFIFEGQSNSAFELRIRTFLKTVTEFLPFINHLEFKIGSRNSFPHSSGIASSASAMSSLALCLVSIEKELFGTPKTDKDFFTKASFIARLGSGSAVRSVYGDWSLWGKHIIIRGSTDEAAVQVNKEFNPMFKRLADAILIVDSGKKKVSSSQGHKTMNDHPFAEVRYRQAGENIKKLINAMIIGDEQSFIKVVESEALSLHAMMISSNDGYSLLKEATWSIIDRIREFRIKSGLFATFTLDAGPNVHLLYQQKDADAIKAFITLQLLNLCETGQWIDDRIGKGPEKLY